MHVKMPSGCSLNIINMFIFFLESISVDSLGRADKVKIFDYQLMAYDSFAHDLIFFLFTSINRTIRKSNFEHFIKHYHKHFYNTLAMLKCPLEDYTYEK